MGIEWLKLSINILNDEKIKLLRKRSDGNELFTMWIGLMCLAMKNDNAGMIGLSDDIPYSTEDLSLLLELNEKTVSVGLDLFKQYGMIDVYDNGFIEVVNFEEHQEIEKIEMYRQKTRDRVAKHRERNKAKVNGNVTVTLPVTLRNGIDKDLDLDKDKEEKKDVASPLSKSKGQKKKKYDNLPPETQDSIKVIYQHLNKLRGFGDGYQHNSDFAAAYLPAKIKEHGQSKIIIMLDYVWYGLKWGESEKMIEFFKPSTLFQYKNKFHERMVAALEWYRKIKADRDKKQYNEKEYQAHLKKLEKESVEEAKRMFGDKKVTKEDFLKLKNEIGEPQKARAP